MEYVVGIDIGGTKCAVILAEVGESIEIIDKVKFDTDITIAPDVIIQKFGDIIDGFMMRFGSLQTRTVDNNTNKTENEFIDMIKSYNINNYDNDTYKNSQQEIQYETMDRIVISSIGISCGGPLNSKEGIIKRPPNLPLWDEIPICKILYNRFNIPVRLQNDANACALAEWKYGAGIGYENMLFLTFGTGLGAGLILDGRLYTGTNDMAGEIGHISLAEFGPSGYGKEGSFEGFCSGSGLAQIGYTMGLAAHQNGNTPIYFDPLTAPAGITAKSIADAAAKGDITAVNVHKFCGKKLGEGLSILIDILNPQLIIIGSIFERSEDLIRESMQEAIDCKALKLSREVCKVVPARLKESLGDYAAITVATHI